MTLQELVPSKLGFGSAPLGNMFRAIPEEEAEATVEAAWNDGIRYFDITPSSRQSRSDWVASDGLHPSGAQYSAWVDVMLEGVATMLR